MANEGRIYLPLEQPERAALIKVDELLPRRVYERLFEAIKSSLNQIPPEITARSFDDQRVHNGVLLAGERGAGKTTVLVNLPQYLRDQDPAVAGRVHVLKPVDPTLLEDNDSLFLNVVVAAVLSDTQVKEARSRTDHQSDALTRAILRLGEAMESRQTLQRDVGLDRLRAFVGSHELAQRVHEFFKAALQLLGKSMFVLPIDDVDTSLGRAFENLEVVRRHLATPVVLPIVCGDLALYTEVVWRDFYERIQPGSQGSETPDGIKLLDLQQAVDKSKQLSHEYLRKLLPMQWRCTMPDLEQQLQNPTIFLATSSERALEGKNQIALPLFHSWLVALLRGPVNGLNRSNRLEVPGSSLRSLFQLLGSVRGLIQRLEQALAMEGVFQGDQTEQAMRLRRALQMPDVPSSVIESFSQQARVADRLRGPLHAFYESVESIEFGASSKLDEAVQFWSELLLDHWHHEPDAGPAWMVLRARTSWNELTRRDTNQPLTVLDTPLFNPVLQKGERLQHFTSGEPLDWRAQLKGLYPEYLINRLPKDSILSFAPPEIGRPIQSDWRYEIDEATALESIEWAGGVIPLWGDELTPDRYQHLANFVISLMLQHGHYSETRQRRNINVGRVLELIVMSIVAEVHSADIRALLTRAPFHSAASVLPTESSEEEGGIDQENFLESGDEIFFALQLLSKALREWRSAHFSALSIVSPWLIHCALNRTLEQARQFNKPLHGNDTPSISRPEEIWSVARAAFNSFWAAVGAFEKGQLFGLRPVVANNNVSSDGDFDRNPLYLQNIAPFASDDAKYFGFITRSLTAAL